PAVDHFADIAVFDKFAPVCRRQAFIDFERKPLVIIQEAFDRLSHKRFRRAPLLRRHARQFSLLVRGQLHFHIKHFTASVYLVSKGGLTFQVPNTIYQFWIEGNYLNVVQSAAMSVLGSPREIKFRAADSGMTDPVVDAHPDRASEALAPTFQDEDSEGAINHGMNPRNRFEAFVV